MIRVEDLHRSFVGQRVLRVLTLQVAPGEIMVVIGRSGGGKSVLLKHLLGLLRPDSGRVVVNGTDITHLRGPALDRILARYGVVFQGGALFDSMSVFDNVAFAPRRARPPLLRSRGAWKLDQVPAGMGHKNPAQISEACARPSHGHWSPSPRYVLRRPTTG